MAIMCSFITSSEYLDNDNNALNYNLKGIHRPDIDLYLELNE